MDWIADAMQMVVRTAAAAERVPLQDTIGWKDLFQWAAYAFGVAGGALWLMVMNRLTKIETAYGKLVQEVQKALVDLPTQYTTKPDTERLREELGLRITQMQATIGHGMERIEDKLDRRIKDARDAEGRTDLREVSATIHLTHQILALQARITAMEQERKA